MDKSFAFLCQRAVKVGCSGRGGETWGGGISQESRAVLWETRGTVPQHPNQASRADSNQHRAAVTTLDQMMSLL